MKTINTVFLILFVSLVVSLLFAESDSFVNLRSATEIDTFVQVVSGGGVITAAVQAADGSYVTTGRINKSSFLAMKFKASGQKQWERRLNFDVDGGVRINDIAQTTEGGFVMAGQTGCADFIGCNGESPSGATLVKLNPNGTVAWKKSLAEPAIGFDYRFVSVSPTPDGGVIATGRRLVPEFDSSPRLFVARFTVAGEVVWAKSFGTLMDSIFEWHFVIHSTATTDNGLIVAFVIPTGGVEVMKINNSGNVAWARLFDLSDQFQTLGATSDGGAILIDANRASKKLKVVVLKANGTLKWRAEYSLRVGQPYFVLSPTQTSDGGYLLTGTSYDTSGKKFSCFILKIDSSRNIAFQNTFGSGGSAAPVFTISGGGFFLFGKSGLGLLVSKVNSEGVATSCGFFHSLGSSAGTFSSSLNSSRANITPSNLLLEHLPFGLASVVTSHPASTICH